MIYLSLNYIMTVLLFWKDNTKTTPLFFYVMVASFLCFTESVYSVFALRNQYYLWRWLIFVLVRVHKRWEVVCPSLRGVLVEDWGPSGRRTVRQRKECRPAYLMAHFNTLHHLIILHLSLTPLCKVFFHLILYWLVFRWN